MLTKKLNMIDSVQRQEMRYTPWTTSILDVHVRGNFVTSGHCADRFLSSILPSFFFLILLLFFNSQKSQCFSLGNIHLWSSIDQQRPVTISFAAACVEYKDHDHPLRVKLFRFRRNLSQWIQTDTLLLRSNKKPVWIHRERFLRNRKCWTLSGCMWCLHAAHFFYCWIYLKEIGERGGDSETIAFFEGGGG